jgi:hypothetical protein
VDDGPREVAAVAHPPPELVRTAPDGAAEPQPATKEDLSSLVMETINRLTDSE